MAEPIPTDTPTMSAVPSRVASTVGTPQSLPPMDPEERTKSINVSLADITAKATALYLAKNYEEAAEVFSQATEMQAELNGEMAPENADILFLYGRSLFKVGQSKSDVLGGKAPAEKKKPGSKDKPKVKKPQAESSKASAPEEKPEAEKVIEEGAAAVAESATKEADKATDDKPLFQFTGDENWEDTDEEEGDGVEEQEGEEEEEEDDLAVAFEILDLSRVLFTKRIEQLEAEEVSGEEKLEEREKIVRHIKERLADTHDLLAEISLENEKFPEAVKDCQSSLDYKLQLYPGDSELIAEAHFKLSLALEFASVTTTGEDDNGAGPKPVDEDMRKEAATQLEKAIASTQLKLNNKEVELAMMHAPEDNDTTRKQITEVKELITDMEQRLVELRKPPMDVNQALGDNNPLAGILGAALGETTAEKEARVEAAKKSANDLSGLVRKRAKEEPKTEAEETNGSGKRKAADDDEVEEGAKKAKVESAAES